jgi:hypothetical protein
MRWGVASQLRCSLRFRRVGTSSVDINSVSSHRLLALLLSLVLPGWRAAVGGAETIVAHERWLLTSLALLVRPAPVRVGSNLDLHVIEIEYHATYHQIRAIEPLIHILPKPEACSICVLASVESRVFPGAVIFSYLYGSASVVVLGHEQFRLFSPKPLGAGVGLVVRC